MNQQNYRKIAKNKRAYYIYNIEQEFESGIVLSGWEVKSARTNTITIDNSYVSFQKKEAYMYNATFHSNIIQHPHTNHNPIQSRKLLLKKHELIYLMEKIAHQRYTIAVLILYWKNSWIKARIGIAKGKKKYEKREMINKNSWNHEKINILRNTY